MNRKIAYGIAALACLVGASAQAGEADTPNVATQSFKVGNIEVVSIHDNHYSIPNDGKVFGVGASPEAVAETLKAAGAPTDLITVQFGGLLVKDGKRLVLIDAGAGASLKGGLLDSLKQAGVTPDQITDVLITHSHFDHVGGLLNAEGKSAFPNAAIRMASKEWAFMQANKDEAPIVAAVAAQVKTFEPGAKISDHVTAVPVDGHTPGHSAYEVDGGSAKLLDVGDSMHSSIVSLAHPEWGISFDSDQDLGQKSRVALLQRLAKSGELIFAPHFPFPSVGTIEAKGSGFAFKLAATK